MNRLFVYGVLIRELATGRASELIAPLGPPRAATTSGMLYALTGADGGWYPILLPGSEGAVSGAVHDAATVDWPAMDAFEDALDNPDREYIRCLVQVQDETGTTGEAFAYCYARDLPAHAVPISHGSFARWLEETGRRAIGSR